MEAKYTVLIGTECCLPGTGYSTIRDGLTREAAEALCEWIQRSYQALGYYVEKPWDNAWQMFSRDEHDNLIYKACFSYGVEE